MRLPADLSRWRRAAELVGRRAECSLLDRLIATVRSGSSQALLVHGEPGVGKTALLEYLAVQALGYRLVRSNGVQSEMELPFAGLHQLCAPLLERLDDLPEPQAGALRTAFGLASGPPPDRFLIGLATLSLLSVTAEDQPLLCLVDDYQWLDGASAQAIAFVARRLDAESVGLVVATRSLSEELEGLPELQVSGLAVADAAALLDSELTGPVDAAIRDQLVAETRGNPLALLELPREFTPAQLAGGFGLPAAGPLSGRIEESFARRAAALDESARQLLLVAAADPSGDSALVWRAATTLGIDSSAASPAVETGLLELGARVRFRHPLARSGIYRSATLRQRQQVHDALAQATDPGIDPDRRAWHQAHAAVGPDEHIAAELEQSAGRARARGGLPAAAAFLLRAATLTLDPAHRATRALAAAETHVQAGSYADVHDLLTMAEAGPLTDHQRAHTDLIRAHLAFVTNRGNDAPSLFLRAAKHLQPIDPQLSRTTYLDALSAAIFAGRLATPGGDVVAVAQSAGTAPPAAEPRVPDLLLTGTAARFNDGYAASLPTLREALRQVDESKPAEEELRWLWLASTTALRIWDDERWDVLSARHLELARHVGALGELPLALTTRAYLMLFQGRLDAAEAMADEEQAIKESAGTALAPYIALGLAAFRGGEDRMAELHGTMVPGMTQRGEGVGITFAEWAKALLCNSLRRYSDALRAAQRAAEYLPDPGALIWPLVELVEAAVRSEDHAAAVDAYDRLVDMTAVCGTDWALGLQARCQALLSKNDVAENLFRESIERLARTMLRVDLARAHLLYGEWLRRERRHTQAREQLRTAHTLFEAMGLTAFAERAAHELRAAGGAAGKRADAGRYDDLTAQEAQIARMARDGLSNPEIAGRLFISPHTVQYHLRKVYAKLGVTSRKQLELVLRPSHDA
ncbi:helix-turn-helix transcriptional regulator [Kribbella speibonae]|uniref:Helix-turn-helix transcriptional regulator n=1 Tax=Kribbella speibonae TaxID=1572660 RepID=A0ABY2AEU3_9ACTN|nr:LuxR family transcriptional regulator [Kribbella speibonae]TCC26831.1 helix-turn-helix transcriptional regulator [Kribbella speibonae]